jgi:hypothetical protein
VLQQHCCYGVKQTGCHLVGGLMLYTRSDRITRRIHKVVLASSDGLGWSFSTPILTKPSIDFFFPGFVWLATLDQKTANFSYRRTRSQILFVIVHTTHPSQTLSHSGRFSAATLREPHLYQLPYLYTSAEDGIDGSQLVKSPNFRPSSLNEMQTILLI